MTVRKQEYLHVHALLAEIAQYLLDQGEMPAGALSEYHALETRPSSANRSKADHQAAVAVLSTAITTWIEETTADEQDVPMA